MSSLLPKRYLFFPLLFGLLCLFGVWGYHLATGHAEESDQLEREIEALESRLSQLPVLSPFPQAEQMGFLTRRTKDSLLEEPILIDLDIGQPHPVDQVFLVPGLSAGGVKPVGEAYLFPKRFRVLISETEDFGEAQIVLDHTHADYLQRVPYPLRIECKGIAARYVRLEITKMGGGGPVYFGYRSMLSELFVFSRGINVALGKEVRSRGGQSMANFYHERYLVDGRTPLGLPELKQENVPKVGWHSRVSSRSGAAVYLDLEFTKTETVDRVIVYPAQPRQFGQIDNYGFPLYFELMGQLPKGDWVPLVQHLDEPYRLPGKNPAVLVFNSMNLSAIRLQSTRLPNIHAGYALVFSEIELFDEGRPLTGVASIRDSGQHSDNENWSREALTDGYSSTGQLIGWHSWLNQLADRRVFLEEFEALSASRAEADSLFREQIIFFVVILLISLPLLGVCFVAYAAFQRNYRRREVMRVRERIAGDLHDEVGSNLGGIQLHLDLLRNEIPRSQEIPIIQHLAAETMTAVRDIVWLLRPRRSERVILADHLREACAILLHGHDWAFDADDASLRCELADTRIYDLMLFYREALHNVRHAGASKISIKVREQGNKLSVSIEDNGCGISDAVLERPSTLSALKKRAEKMHAHMQLETQLGKGTVVALTLPLD